jgi:hypothetical protein
MPDFGGLLLQGLAVTMGALLFSIFVLVPIAEAFQLPGIVILAALNPYAALFAWVAYQARSLK